MENCRSIILSFAILAMLIPAWLFAYEPNTTHDALTHEAVDFYNAFSPAYGTPKLSADERTLIQRGAMEEDDDYRMAHHFYDPVRRIGLKGYMSSKTWAQSPAYQASWKNGLGGCLLQPHLLFPLYESPCDYSWQRAIYDYAYGDATEKARAMKALGHTLHLIEDASVPDHTRNDAHIPIFDSAIQQFDESFGEKSPFEGFADQFSLANNNVQTAQELMGAHATPYTLTSLDSYFDNAALYSNSNFFSKSTIFDKNYALPIIESYEERHLSTGNTRNFGKYKNHFLVQIETREKLDGTIIKTYDIQDADKIILTAYWNLTSRDAVKNAAGVIRLFFEEVEKEKQTHALHNAKAALVQQVAVAGVKGTVAVGVFGVKIAMASVRGIESAARFAARSVTNTLLATHVMLLRGSDTTQTIASNVPATTATIPAPMIATLTHGEKPPIKTTQIIERSTADFLGLIAQLLAAREELARLAEVSVSNGDNDRPQGEVAGASTIAAPYRIHSNALGSGGGGGVVDSNNTATVIVLSDSTVAAPLVIPDATTTADLLEALDIEAPPAPTILAIISQGDTAPNVLNPFQLSTTSAVISGTAEAGALIALSWAVDTATIVFETRATTTSAWSASILLPLGTTTLGASAIDAAGNVSSTTSQTVVVTLPTVEVEAPSPAAPTVIGTPRVIFNEIAWGGTDASPDDEWLELYNAGDGAADLSHYYIDIGSGADMVTIPLSGTLAAGEYLIVRNNERAVDVQGSPLDNLDNALFVLPDAGAELTLGETTPDGAVVADHLAFCADWCGKGGAGVSMERWRIDRATDLPDNWGTNDNKFRSGLDRDGNLVHGTPGARNSINYRLSLSNTISGMQSFAKGLGTYVIFSTLTIPLGSSLTLGAGTVVKFNSVGEPKLMVNGTLVAEGTASAPVIFTALGDDSVGGDTMQDGTLVPALVPRMTSVSIVGASSTANLTNTEFHFANTALFVNNGASVTLASTTIVDGSNGLIVSRSTLVSDDLLMNRVNSTGISGSNGSTLSLASTTIINAEGVGISLSSGVHMDADGLTMSNLGRGISMRTTFVTVTDMLIDRTNGRAIDMSGFSILDVSSSTISNSSFVGINISSATLHAEDISLLNNQRGIVSSRGVVQIHDSIIAGNMLTGISNATPSIGAPIDATGNYWGDPDGPTLPGGPINATDNYWTAPDRSILAGAPAGSTGDTVTVGVLTTPFLTAPSE